MDVEGTQFAEANKMSHNLFWSALIYFVNRRRWDTRVLDVLFSKDFRTFAVFLRHLSWDRDKYAAVQHSARSREILLNTRERSIDIINIHGLCFSVGRSSSVSSMPRICLQQQQRRRRRITNKILKDFLEEGSGSPQHIQYMSFISDVTEATAADACRGRDQQQLILFLYIQ